MEQTQELLQKWDARARRKYPRMEITGEGADARRRNGVWNLCMVKGYNIHAYWERRAETPDALAARFVRMIDRLREIPRT